MKNDIIPNQKELEEKKKKILEKGAEKFHVLADFDRTLTKAFADGKVVPSVIAQMRIGDYISPEYAEKSHALYEKYYPFEMDFNISEGQRAIKMQKWWSEHFDLLIKSGLNKKDIEKVAKEGTVEFREGIEEFLDFLHRHNIPLIILSSSGLGDIIPMYFKKKGKLYDNIHIISNFFEFDKKGKALGIKGKIIHIANKNEASLEGLPIYKELLKRKNVLLLGDTLDDLKMIEGFDYDVLIKVGFLNYNVKQSLEKFKQNFDMVLLNDTNMSYVNKLLEEIIL